LVVLFPGVKEVLSELRNRGIKIVVSTTRSKITSLASIEQVGILNNLDLVLSVEDVTAPRPNPDCIRKSMEQFSILPEETLMIGDRAIDMDAGKNIGVKTVGVMYGAEGKRIANSRPDYTIEEISQLLSIMS
jgi:pyrophosphatase PpaX